MFGFGPPELILIFFILGFFALLIWFIVYLAISANRSAGQRKADGEQISSGFEKRHDTNEEELRQHIRDEEHLKLLSLGYKVSAGISAFYSMFGFFYAFMGALVVSIGPVDDGDPASLIFGGIFIVIGLSIVLIGFTYAALKWRAANLLKKRQSMLFCQIIAGISCLGIPYGTFLGVFTFMVLSRPSVSAMFKSEKKQTNAV